MSTAKHVGIIATVLVVVALYATACHTSTDEQSIHTEEISKSTFRGTWPLIPDSGVLACEAGAISFTPTGTNDTYAVNAIAYNFGKQYGWRQDLEHIWLTADGGQNDTQGVLRVTLSDFMNEGLKLCGPPWGSSVATDQTMPNPQTTQVELRFTGLKAPEGVAVDTAGNVYVTDDAGLTSGINRVLKLPAGSSTQVQLPFTGLKDPGGVAVDTAGNVYVIDGINRVLKLPAGSSTQVQLPFTGLKGAGGVAVDTAGNVYVVDGTNRVLKLPAGSSTQVQLPFTGLTSPGGIAVDTAGNVYVSDYIGGQVLKLPAGSDTQVRLPFAGLTSPESVAVDTAGNVYVVDISTSRVVKLPAG